MVVTSLYFPESSKERVHAYAQTFSIKSHIWQGTLALLSPGDAGPRLCPTRAVHPWVLLPLLIRALPSAVRQLEAAVLLLPTC